MSENRIVMYTDGAALGNPGPGGYGTILIWGPHKKEFAEGFRRTTNNRMELLAVIIGLEAIKKPGMTVDVYTDSKYVEQAVTKGWVFNWVKKGFKDKKNPDLWRRYLAIAKNHTVNFHWVKGHAGIPGNERCDELATNMAANHPVLVDTAYEQGLAG
ncbi:MAG: ribonuclease HI [Bacteroidia bacterium]|nr:ribonuclease HI [Bacteroidia bacterium]